MPDGLLHSQIGYDIGEPMRALIRSDESAYAAPGSTFEVRDAASGEALLSGDVTYWGPKWGAHWWAMDFSGLDRPGWCKLVVRLGGGATDGGAAIATLTSDTFRVGHHLLWDETMVAVALDQMEERAALARNGKGWKDCGSSWREANSHASMVIGLCDLLSIGYEWLSPADVARLRKQVARGCRYLAICQDAAAMAGHPEGAVVHELPNHLIVIPADVAQSVVAFARAARLLADTMFETASRFLRRAISAHSYLMHTARPYGPEGFSCTNHGAPEGFLVPNDFMTRDLMMMLWGSLELFAAGQERCREDAFSLARRVLRRQVPESRREGPYYGHFETFEACGFTEKANIHHHVGHDTGGSFPFYIIPLMEMCRRWYDHPEAPVWRKAVTDFAYGFFLPACSANPFHLMPEGYFTGEGILHFCGPWHGMNTSLAFGATLATRLEEFTGDRRFRDIAVGNIQWIAGLNAGLTQEAMGGCTLWREDVPVGAAIPYSQIVGIGSRSVGCWTGIRGTIPNGFSVNPQFQLSVRPEASVDAPRLFTDEDWIPHSAGWISALSHRRQFRFFAG